MTQAAATQMAATYNESAPEGVTYTVESTPPKKASKKYGGFYMKRNKAASKNGDSTTEGKALVEPGCLSRKVHSPYRATVTRTLQKYLQEKGKSSTWVGHHVPATDYKAALDLGLMDKETYERAQAQYEAGEWKQGKSQYEPFIAEGAKDAQYAVKAILRENAANDPAEKLFPVVAGSLSQEIGYPEPAAVREGLRQYLQEQGKENVWVGQQSPSADYAGARDVGLMDEETYGRARQGLGRSWDYAGD